MKNTAKIMLGILIASMVYSCLAPIDVATKNGDAYVNIYGYLTTDTTQHHIRITYSDYFFSAEPPRGIGNALVSISDEDGNVMVLTESPDTAGLYLTDCDAYAIEGKMYTLNVEVDIDNDGIKEHFQAKSDVPYSAKTDSIVLTSGKLPYLPFVKIYGEVPQNQKNYLAIYCSKNNDTVGIFDYLMIVEDWYFDNSNIQGTEFPLFIEDGIEIGDTLHFRVNSFNQEFAHFSMQVRTETSPSNPILSSPPANVISNVKLTDEGKSVNVVGFFSTFSYKTAFRISDTVYPPMMRNDR
ncbi:MAG: DUF4249 domain-containing protein [Prevotellaceae bacterium]|jgi:hypothetical protein|nr:DUF4249 domain-containing protein [Prevotellaceae bacterium]